jgi:phage baseplate assembly protein gpV
MPAENKSVMSDQRLIRIGQISSIDYDKNLVKVTYPDMDDAVTDDIPYFSFDDEYKMPEVGRDVLVLHLSSGSAEAVCMGRYWNEDVKPQEKGKGVWRKELGTEFGKAYAQYKASDKELKIHVDGDLLIECDKNVTVKAKSITFVTDQGTTTF